MLTKCRAVQNVPVVQIVQAVRKKESLANRIICKMREPRFDSREERTSAVNAFKNLLSFKTF